MRNLDIAEVAQQCRLPASALRFYEEKGLIKSIGRRGLRRVYAAGIVERLALVALGRAAGFSLEEIAGITGAQLGTVKSRMHYAKLALRKLIEENDR